MGGGAGVLERVVGNAEGPEEMIGTQAAVEIVLLHREARTGLEEINSHEGERAVEMPAVAGHVEALIGAQVDVQIVAGAGIVRRAAAQITERGKAVEVGDGAGVDVEA